MERETTTLLGDPEIPLGLIVHMAGITHPDPHYRMNRWEHRSGYYIFEAIISGRGVLETEDTTHYLEAGDAYLISPGCICEYYSVKHDPWEKIWFNVSGELVEQLCGLYNLKGILTFKQIHLENEFRQALDPLLAHRSSAYENLALALHNIIAKFYMFRYRQQIPAYSPDAVKLRDYLDISWTKKVSQQELCSLINKSPAQMQRIFKNQWGISPGKYLQQKRLKMAIHYLENTSFTIRRIAEHVGFSNEYYFANWFKEQTGVAPKSYISSVANAKRD